MKLFGAALTASLFALCVLASTGCGDDHTSGSGSSSGSPSPQTQCSVSSNGCSCRIDTSGSTAISTECSEASSKKKCCADSGWPSSTSSNCACEAPTTGSCYSTSSYCLCDAPSPYSSSSSSYGTAQTSCTSPIGTAPYTGSKWVCCKSTTSCQCQWQYSDTCSSGESTTSCTADTFPSTCASGKTEVSSCSAGSPSYSGSSTTACQPDGTWGVDFKWDGRTPGSLTIVGTTGGSAQILAGDGVAATTGTATVSGNEITWVWNDGSTFKGTATNCTDITSGTMSNTAGNHGTFQAVKGGTPGGSSSGSSECHGCTADSDCSRCERCERSSCRCVARLTCN